MTRSISAICFICLAPLALHADVVTQTFDSESTAFAAGWVAAGSTLNGNNFGFSASDNTGGNSPAGEAGGLFSRSTTQSYYADISATSSLNRDTSIIGSGEFDVTSISVSPAFDGEVRIGHFDRNGTSFMGWIVAEQNATSIRAIPRITFDDGVSRLGNALTLSGFPNSDRTWSYSWDSSTSALAFTIDGTGGGTSILQLLSEDDTRSVQLNSFGFLSPGLTSSVPNSTIRTYVDNVSYSTAAVPEPSHLSLLGVAAVFVLFGRRVRQRTNRALTSRRAD